MSAYRVAADWMVREWRAKPVRRLDGNDATGTLLPDQYTGEHVLDRDDRCRACGATIPAGEVVLELYDSFWNDYRKSSRWHVIHRHAADCQERPS